MGRTRAAAASEAASLFAPLHSFLGSQIDAGLVPGAVFVAGRSGGAVHRAALGRRALQPRIEPMTEDTIFDLASLTKPLVTAALAVERASAHDLHLEDPLERHLEEARGTEAGSARLSMLLTHTAGFPAMNPLEDYRGGKPRLYAAIAREPLEARPGERFTYSDVGYMLLQGVVERATGKGLDRAAQERIFTPLRFRDTRFGTRAKDRLRVAPTTRERGVWLRGRVHDPRARSRALGGVAGNAGVFGTGEEVARFCEMLLRGGTHGGRRILASETVRLMTTNQCGPALGVRRGFGFDIESPYSAPRGSLFSSDSFGHSGFTGVSMWIDPTNDAYFVLLTNSIHAGGHKDLKAFRSQAATLAARGLGI
ncbi:MAG: beta-lactamase family protein [Candidatus Eisenbacteria bacterium]|uniref:Beta-lactamase family protein n=1 Tax=Eiseniibacteriota bacterium TaxID=2212470 RepID=A0A538T4H5_UNCEI|nr:MAG: beta-lactamase family protein [Candidatus Eisenbacteria bacterium]